MYVIRDTDGRIYPADRCTFQVDPTADNKGYRLAFGDGAPIFWDGNSSTGTNLGGSSGNRCELGYIGKTGRFVAITSRED